MTEEEWRSYWDPILERELEASKAPTIEEMYRRQKLCAEARARYNTRPVQKYETGDVVRMAGSANFLVVCGPSAHGVYVLQAGGCGSPRAGIAFAGEREILYKVKEEKEMPDEETVRTWTAEFGKDALAVAGES
jgi:hypothetical protein